MKFSFPAKFVRPGARSATPLILQNRFGSRVGGLLTVLAGLFFCNQQTGSSLISWSYDLPFSLRQPEPPANLVIVLMNEDAHEELGIQYEGKAWPREIHARLLNRLREEGSRTVVFDVVFTRATAPPRSVSNSDRAATLQLAAAITNHGRVAIAGTIRELWKGRVKGFTYEAPDGRLKAAGVGVAEMLDERDTTVRLLKTEWRVSGQSYSTLAWEAARIEGAASVAAGTPALGSAWLNYLGPPRTIETVSYDNALNGLPRGYFSNKVVVVGADYQTSVIGAKVDTFRSPFPIGKPRFAGVELHATVLANLLAGDWLRRAPPMVEFLVIALIGGLAGAFLPRLQPLAATGAALGFIALVAALGIILHRQAQFWFPWMIPVAVQIPAALVWAIMFQALRGYVENTLLERSLAHYLSPKQVSLILKHPEQLSLGGQEQRISILFSDIANFSKLSERMDAESLVKLLNEYYAEAIGCVHATDGTVVKLIGDCIFAVWNAPQPQSAMGLCQSSGAPSG